MAIGGKLSDEARREQERKKKARQRARKKSGAVREVTIRIYDEDALRAIIVDGKMFADQAIREAISTSQGRFAPHWLKISLAEGVEQWIETLCQLHRLWESHEMWQKATDTKSGLIERASADKPRLIKKR